MLDTLQPNLDSISTMFAEEVALLGGSVSDRYLDDHLLVMRSVLNRTSEATPGDVMKGGVALRATGEQITVCPYLFREVCRNGAIRCQALESRCIDRVADHDNTQQLAVIETDLRAAIRACAGEDAFRIGMNEIRRTTNREMDDVLMLLPAMQHFSRRMLREIFRAIQQRREESGDRSAFGMINAITSLARDTHAPEMRWRLEELGGGVPALIKPRPLPRPGRAQVREYELV